MTISITNRAALSAAIADTRRGYVAYSPVTVMDQRIALAVLERLKDLGWQLVKVEPPKSAADENQSAAPDDKMSPGTHSP